MLEYPFDSDYILQNKRAIKKQLLQKPALLDKKIAVVSGTTIGELPKILELFLLDAGIKPEMLVGEYARYYEEIVFDDGTLAAFKPDILFINTNIHSIDAMPLAGESREAVDEKFKSVTAKFETVWKAAEKLGCPVIQNNFEYPRVRVMGNREAYDASGKIRFINRLNEYFADHAERTMGFFINDINYLSSWYGLERWSDPTYYNAYKYAQSPDAMPLLCQSVANIIKSVFGKNKKALMLDLDNTLWGGVIGDDGVEGIKLGTEAPEGIAYSELQKYAKELTGIGVILGVVSKNEDAAARSGFTHPSSTLKTDDFAIFLANWNDKSSNLAAAAQTLSLGSDSFVFVDDNPAEREIVRSYSDGVTVVELGEPERYAETVSAGGYFEVTSLSDDDRKRAAMYRENAARATLEQSFVNYGEYLDSLEMKGYFGPVTDERLARVTQLANKSNQFNLTTRRYTVEEMAERAASDEYITLTGRLEDRFGDNGLVSVVIGKNEGNGALGIELWIMSCRVLRRELEQAMLDMLVEAAREKGYTKLIGRYFKTAKNAMVRDFYSTMGFELVGEDGDDRTFEYAIPDDYKIKTEHIEIIKD